MTHDQRRIDELEAEVAWVRRSVERQRQIGPREAADGRDLEERYRDLEEGRDVGKSVASVQQDLKLLRERRSFRPALEQVIDETGSDRSKPARHEDAPTAHAPGLVYG